MMSKEREKKNPGIAHPVCSSLTDGVALEEPVRKIPRVSPVIACETLPKHFTETEAL
jgi:hypothetical protein